MNTEDVVIQVPDANVIVDQQPADVLVMPVPEAAVFIEDAAPSVVTLDEETDLLVLPVEDTQVVVAAGEQGPPGIPGPAGGQVLERTAGEQLSALRAVFEGAAGRVWLADATEAGEVFTLLGVTTTAAEANQQVLVQRLGSIDDAAWGWTPGVRVYLGAAGQLTQTSPATGFDVLIGVALSPTRLLLNIQDPIEME
ncbi:capsid cement protein [Comamonas odontotermitis]|uniref:capsid cement protein n=1 Tax=Comamonas odontotermitis TaxID=379895 RepID=UPI001CC44509|nr:capsid cement protein [Comamonas odontotermitis]UBB15412.1 DUF2190 family protein [Comamonas odontotermitis]